MSLPLFLLQHRLDPRAVAAKRPDLDRHVELSHRLLHPHPEQLVLEILLAAAQFIHVQIAQFRRVHYTLSSAKRVANFVRIGSFAAARRIADRASVSLTPSIS